MVPSRVMRAHPVTKVAPVSAVLPATLVIRRDLALAASSIQVSMCCLYKTVLKHDERFNPNESALYIEVSGMSDCL